MENVDQPIIIFKAAYHHSQRCGAREGSRDDGPQQVKATTGWSGYFD